MGNTQRIVCFVFLVILSVYAVDAMISVGQPGTTFMPPVTNGDCIDITFSRPLWTMEDVNLYIPVSYIFGDLSQCKMFNGYLDSDDNCIIGTSNLMNVSTKWKWTSAEGLTTYEQTYDDFEFREEDYAPFPPYSGTPIQAVFISSPNTWIQTGWCPPPNTPPEVGYMCYFVGGITGSIKICKKGCISDEQCSPGQICQDNICVAEPDPAIKRDAIQTLQIIQEKLKNSFIKTDSEIYGESFSVFGCAINLIPSNFNNDYADIAYELGSFTLEQIGDSSNENAASMKVSDTYSNAEKAILNPRFLSSVNDIFATDNTQIKRFANTEFEEDVYHLQRLAVYDANNFSESLEGIIEKHNTGELTNSIAFLGIGILGVISGPGGWTMLAFSFIKGATECALDLSESGNFVALLSKMSQDQGARTVWYTHKIRDGIIYMDSSAFNPPRIEISENMIGKTVTNLGDNPVNIDLAYEISYHSNTDVSKLLTQDNYYQGGDSFSLNPGETKVLLLNHGDYIDNWFEQVSNSCFEYQKTTGAMVRQEFDIKIFYGEENTIALKTLEFYSDKPIVCNFKKSSGGGGSSSSKVLEVSNETNASSIQTGEAIIISGGSGSSSLESNNSEDYLSPITGAVVTESSNDTGFFAEVLSQIFNFFKWIFG